MSLVSVQLGYKDSAWFTANPTLVLKAGQKVHLLQTGTYKLGDGVTQLGALVFLGGSAATGITLKRSHEIYTVGDSITANGGYQTQLLSLIGASTWNTVNYGVPGNTTADILARLSTVTIGDAEYIIVLAGINDIVQGFSAATIQANLQTIYTACAATGAKVIALNITPFKNNVNWSAGKQTILTTVNSWISSTATGLTYIIDTYTALNDVGNTGALLAAYDSGDGLHPNAAGQVVMGNTINAGATFTASVTVPTLSLARNISLSQSLSPLDIPAFSGLSLAGALTMGNNTIGSGNINSTGTVAASSFTASLNSTFTGIVYTLNSFQLGTLGVGGSITNGGTSIKVLSGSSFPDIRFCTTSATNGRLGVNNTSGAVLIGDIPNMTDDGSTNLQIQTSMNVPIIDVKSNAGSQTSLITFTPYASNNSAIKFNTSAGVNRGLIDLNIASGEMKFWGQAGGYFVTIGANGSEAIRVTTSQTVGIGTGATVSAKTHVISTTEQLRLGFDASNYIAHTVGSAGTITATSNGTSPGFAWTSAAATTGAVTTFTFTSPNNTTQTASTNIPKVLWTMGSTQFANGAIATQEFFKITQPTIAHVSGSNTVTATGNLVVIGAPTTSGGFTTLTSSSGILVQTATLTGVTTGYGIFANAPSGATTNFALGTQGVLIVNDGTITGGIQLSALVGTTSSAAIYANQATPSATNFVFSASTTATSLNASTTINLRLAGTAAVAVTSTAVTMTDAVNFVLGTTTGTKIGTATTQKIGFFNATPIVQVGATIDLGVVMSNLGLRAAGTAYTITTSGAVGFSGLVTITANNIATDTTTGMKIGTATTQKLGFYNATPVVQQTGGVATAGAVYTATEQAMLQTVYNMSRTMGLLS